MVDAASSYGSGYSIVSGAESLGPCVDRLRSESCNGGIIGSTGLGGSPARDLLLPEEDGVLGSISAAGAGGGPGGC